MHSSHDDASVYKKYPTLRRLIQDPYMHVGSTPTISTGMQSRPSWAVFACRLVYWSKQTALLALGVEGILPYFRGLS